MKYEGLIEYAKEHTIKECANKYACCYKCMNSYLYKHKIPYKKDFNKLKGKESPSYKHGEVNTRLYQIWVAMRHRCSDKHNKHYGAKGITVCLEWQDFSVFRDWAYTHGYTDSLTLDRIDNNKGYSSMNCRWVSQKAQNNNKSTNRVLIYKGESKTISQWAEKYHIKKQTLYSRLARGWPLERALGVKIC